MQGDSRCAQPRSVFSEAARFQDLVEILARQSYGQHIVLVDSFQDETQAPPSVQYGKNVVVHFARRWSVAVLWLSRSVQGLRERFLARKGPILPAQRPRHPRRPPVSPRRRAPHPDQSQPAPPAHGAVARGLSAYPPSRTSRRAPANGFGRHGCTGAYLIDVEAPSPTAPSRDTACMRPEQLFSTTYGCCGCEGMCGPRHRRA